MSEFDNHLKEARTAIAAKQFPVAIEHCQNALRIKKNSYMALVLLGAALQDRIEAKAVFNKAISIKDTTPLAYHGLAKYYDKCGDVESLRALLDIYGKILEIDNESCESVCINIYDTALKVGECTKCANILYDAAVKETIIEKKNIIFIHLIKTLNSVTDIPWEEFLLLFGKVIDLIPYTELIEKICNSYLQCMYVNRGYDEMFKTGVKLLQSHDSTILREFLCKSFCQVYILKSEFIIDLDEIENILEDFMATDPNSHIGQVTNSIIHLIRKEALIAYNISVSVKNQNKNNALFPLLYGQCCLALGRWSEAEVSVKLLINHPDASYCRCAKSILLTSLSMQEDEKQCSIAIKLSKTQGIPFTDSEYTALFHAYVELKLYSEAKECLNKLKNPASLPSLTATLLHKCGKTTEAIALLIQNTNDVSCCTLLGRLYKEGNDLNNAVQILIQAASIESQNYTTYALLGECYMLREDILEKAKKCFHKALELNPECSLAGKLLSKIYVKLKDWGSNYELLKKLMDSVSHLNPVPFGWIWLQLGLHYLALEQWDDAIGNWRVYIRLNPSDIDAWVLLAEAYFSRGSYTSALKCFNKVIDMDPGRKYCYIQIATIEYMLGMLDNSLNTFQKVSDSKYLPALKGLAEVKLCISQEKLSKNFYGLARDNAQESIDSISMAIQQNPNLSCLWKILYQAITIIASLPAKYCWLYFSPDLLPETTRRYLISDMYLLAMQCIEKAISISNTPNSYFYHELATTYFKYFKYSKNVVYAKKAYVMTQKCIGYEMKNWQHWNLLGIICSSEELKKYALAQHSFIKALDLDPCNPTLWSNLGVFYLITGNTIMANRTFMKAQESNPSFIQSWIGQALIAESIGNDEAIDLFRHASQLGFHTESSLGYAYLISNKLAEPQIGSSITYSIEHMHAIPDSCDLISMYNEFEGDNPCSWNIYGILLEKLGRYNSAIKAFIKSLKYVSIEYRNIVLLNLGRLYFKADNYPSAIDTVKTISELDCNSVCLLAECYLKNDQIKDAYLTYIKALEYNTITDNGRAEILIALANIAFICNEKEYAELLIFQCVELQPTSLFYNAILALCAKSLLFSDRSLAYLAFVVLDRSYHSMFEPIHKCILNAYRLLKFENAESSIKYLSKHIMTTPNNPHVWQLMSRITTQDVTVVNISSKKTLLYGSPIEFVSTLKLACVSELLAGNYKRSKVLAQKAILSNPGNAENWSLLVNVLLKNQSIDNQRTEVINNWLKMVISRIIQNLSMKTVLFNWFTTVVDNIAIT